MAYPLHGDAIMRRLSPIHVLSTLALATLAIGGAPACTSRSCNAMYVPNQATIQRKVTARFDAAKPIHVEICKNDDCDSGDFVVADATRGNGRLCRTDGSLPFETGCTFVRTGDGAFAFQASWLGEETPWSDGDRYRVTLTSSEGTLLNVDTKATYTESEPNGEGCGTTKAATL